MGLDIEIIIAVVMLIWCIATAIYEQLKGETDENG